MNTSKLVEQLNALIMANLAGEAQGALKEYLEKAAKAIKLVPELEEKAERRIEITQDLRKSLADSEREVERLKGQEAAVLERAKELGNLSVALDLRKASMDGRDELHAGTKSILDAMLQNRVVREAFQDSMATPVSSILFEDRYDPATGNTVRVPVDSLTSYESTVQRKETTREEG